MKRSYDLVVLGTGTAGSTVAHRCRSTGWTVAIVDSRPFGGTCALRGCDPKKVLVVAAETVDRVRRMEEHGVPGPVGIDWPRLMAFKRMFTDPVPGEREQRFEEAGIDTFHGRARFVEPRAVEVDGTVLSAERIVIATGAKPMAFPFPGNEHLVTSEAFLELESETSGWYSSRREGARASAFKTLIDVETGEIVGAHLLGPHAEETINVFALAIRYGLTASDLKREPWAYPTATSDVPHMV